MELKLDLHVHSDRSPDGIDSLPRIREAALARGLDGVALCDHNLLSEALPGRPMVIPGCECSTAQGHILALFIDKPISCLRKGDGPLPSAKEVIDEIHCLGGVAVWAHPYERAGRVAEDAATGADLIEIANARACFKNSKANDKARDLAARLKKPGCGGSDGHSAAEVGNAYTVVTCDGASLEEVKAALLAGDVSAVLERETPRFRKGLSQLAKYRKTHAPLARRAKGYLYLLYCILLDWKGR